MNVSPWAAIIVAVIALFALGLWDKTRGVALAIVAVLALTMTLKKVNKDGGFSL